MNNVAVYAIARKYEVPQLKALTMVTFHYILSHSPNNPKILSVVNAVFETSSSGDSGLREFITDYCTHFAGKYIHNENVNGVIKDHGNLGLGMLQKMHAKHVEEKQQLSRQITVLQSLEKIFFFRAHGIRSRLSELISIADKSGDASSHSHAQKLLKMLGSQIRQVHKIADVEDLRDAGLETRPPA